SERILKILDSGSGRALVKMGYADVLQGIPYRRLEAQSFCLRQASVQILDGDLIVSDVGIESSDVDKGQAHTLPVVGGLGQKETFVEALQRPREIAQLIVNQSEIVQNDALADTVVRFLVDRQGLLKVVDGLGVVLLY